MNLSRVWMGILLLFIITVITICDASVFPDLTMPWAVTIHKINLLGSNNQYEHHCTGALTSPQTVLTSAKCLDTFPENAHMVLFAGGAYTGDRDFSHVQKIIPVGHRSVKSTTELYIYSQRTNYVDFIQTCNTQNCMFDTYGYQYDYGYGKAKFLQMTEYDFSNSSSMCLELNENPKYKYCTYHLCHESNINTGGEILAKVHKGQLQYASGYAFGYRVRDFHTGNDFGHTQNRDIDGITRGQYHILLPDGRVQNVKYHADEKGFHADVSYETVE